MNEPEISHVRKEETNKSRGAYLEMIEDEFLFIPATDGTRKISDASSEVFPGGGALKFDSTGRFPSPSTKEISVQICKLVSSGVLSNIYKSVTAEADKLVLTQAQILKFVEQPQHWAWFRLMKVSATFFLYMSRGELEVACVQRINAGPKVTRLKFNNLTVLEPQDNYHFVLPKVW